MMVREEDPEYQLLIQTVRLVWIDSYQHRAVWVDKRLSFAAYAYYLRQRMWVRLNVMQDIRDSQRAPPSPSCALYYVKAVRSLVNYSAPVLIALSPNKQELLEVV